MHNLFILCHFSAEEEIEAEINNIKMAEKLLKVIHTFDGGPIPLVGKKAEKAYSKKHRLGISESKKQKYDQYLDEKSRRRANRIGEPTRKVCCCM